MLLEATSWGESQHWHSPPPQRQSNLETPPGKALEIANYPLKFKEEVSFLPCPPSNLRVHRKVRQAFESEMVSASWRWEVTLSIKTQAFIIIRYLQDIWIRREATEHVNDTSSEITGRMCSVFFCTSKTANLVGRNLSQIS